MYTCLMWLIDRSTRFDRFVLYCIVVVTTHGITEHDERTNQETIIDVGPSVCSQSFVVVVQSDHTILTTTANSTTQKMYRIRNEMKCDTVTMTTMTMTIITTTTMSDPRCLTVDYCHRRQYVGSVLNANLG
jgi:hypothetical protein